ncbi:MAG TPA: hypothetical protein DGT21_25030 [Armatimonadetes bacterium]|nr:hypothetical protein [Armatimonadota bacterium]
MRSTGAPLIALLAVLAAATCVPQDAVGAPTLDEMGRLYEVSTHHARVTFPSSDEAGYGSALAWGTSYAMLTLNLLFEVTGDTAYLEKQFDLAEQAFRKRDIDLAAATGNQAKYTDYQRNRVMSAWGTGSYSQGQYTCWAVHAGMVCFPVAETVRLVRAGGEKTTAYSQRAGALVPLIEEAMTEFDSEWRDGPEPGQGYYLFPNGSILPLNQQNAPGRALFVLAELTGKQEYRDKADKLAAFMKSKLTHVADGDYYLWAYSPGSPTGAPGRGEDVSHAAINAHFMYLAWSYGSTFDDTEMARLTRTFTDALYLGNGQFSGTVGGNTPNDNYTPQLPRWCALARFDPRVEQYLLEYVGAHPKDSPGTLGATTGAMAYGYLMRARMLRE